MKLTPTTKATTRTRNRIREHGPTFHFIREESGQWLLSVPATYDKFGWHGWLHRNEFSVREGENK